MANDNVTAINAARRRRHGGGHEAGDDGRPVIQVIGNELPRVIMEAEDALMTSSIEVFQRGGLVVRPARQVLKAADGRDTTSWGLVYVTSPDLVVLLTDAARFEKFDKRAKEFIPIDAPSKVADAFLASFGRWRLEVLKGIIGTPFLRADGSLCTTPGYDPGTGLLFKPDQEFPAIPDRPTKQDALVALGELEDVLAGFPFVTEADRTVALSAILTVLDRHNLPIAPMHAFTAPASRTGKSKLVDIASVIATGRTAPVIGQGADEEELEKRLTAELLAGRSVISIDNCDHMLRSGFLCQVLSQDVVSPRVLGLSKNVDIPTAGSSVFCTGNNLRIVGDLTQRTVLCSLDAKTEHPERRHFDIDAVDMVRGARARLVVAALTVLRAWLLTGEDGPAHGDYRAWSQRVRGALMWLGCDDPCATVERVKARDPKRAGLAAVVEAWKSTIGTAEKTAGEIIQASTSAGAEDLRDALVTVAADKTGRTISNVNLGRWLASVQDQVSGGYRIESTPYRKQALWRLTRMPDGVDVEMR